MSKNACFIVFFAMISAFSAINCSKHAQKNKDKVALEKIKFDLEKIGTDGLNRAKTPVEYEFCLPANREVFDNLKKIDPTLKKMKGKGRVGCTNDEWLVMGNTRQKNWKTSLINLAKTPEIREIREVFWE
jgi:hypothetical protein